MTTFIYRNQAGRRIELKNKRTYDWQADTITGLSADGFSKGSSRRPVSIDFRLADGRTRFAVKERKIVVTSQAFLEGFTQGKPANGILKGRVVLSGKLKSNDFIINGYNEKFKLKDDRNNVTATSVKATTPDPVSFINGFVKNRSYSGTRVIPGGYKASSSGAFAFDGIEDAFRYGSGAGLGIGDAI